jgi:hypothetical protein
LFLQTGEPLEIEALTPFADDLPRHVETGGDAFVAKPMTRQKHDFSPHDVTIRRRIVPGPGLQFGSFPRGEINHEGAFSGHDASSWTRMHHAVRYEPRKNTSLYL